MDGGMGGQWMCGGIRRAIGEHLNGQKDGWRNGWRNGLTVGWRDGYMCGGDGSKGNWIS